VSARKDLSDAAKEDLNFMQWVANATNEELHGQHAFAVGWQKIALAREIEKRNQE
jgi:hypothetical protein